MINLKKKELKMLNLLLKEVEVQLNIILNPKTDSGQLLQMLEEEEDIQIMMIFLNLIHKLLI